MQQKTPLFKFRRKPRDKCSKASALIEKWCMTLMLSPNLWGLGHFPSMVRKSRSGSGAMLKISLTIVEGSFFARQKASRNRARRIWCVLSGLGPSCRPPPDTGPSLQSAGKQKNQSEHRARRNWCVLRGLGPRCRPPQNKTEFFSVTRFFG